MALDYFLSLCKPDCVRLGYVGEVIRRFENSGLTLIHVKWAVLTREQVTLLYADKRDEEFFPELLEFMTSGPVVVTVWQGESANQRGRQQVGSKDPLESEAGSLRGSLPAQSKVRSFVHGSRTPEEAYNEMLILVPERWEGTPVPASERPADETPFAPAERAVPALMRPWAEPAEAGCW